MLTQSTFDFGLHGLSIERPQSAGQWIRSLREERQIKGSDVERISRNIAKEKGNRNFYIPHGTLADIEHGSIPSIHKLFSLAICLRVSLHDLLFVFGIEAEEINHAIAEAPVETQCERKREDRDTDDWETHREYMRKWRAAQVYEVIADSYQPMETPQERRADKHERMVKLVRNLTAKAAMGAVGGR